MVSGKMWACVRKAHLRIELRTLPSQYTAEVVERPTVGERGGIGRSLQYLLVTVQLKEYRRSITSVSHELSRAGTREKRLTA